MGGQGGHVLPTFWSGGDALCFPLSFWGSHFLIHWLRYKGYCLAKMSVWLVFVRRRTVFATTVFFEDVLILTVTGFSDLHSALRQSMHAIIRVANCKSYRLPHRCSLPKPHPHSPIGPLGLEPVPLLLCGSIRVCLFVHSQIVFKMYVAGQFYAVWSSILICYITIISCVTLLPVSNSIYET